MMRMSELQTKKIINVSTGRNMGNIIDADIRENGTVESLLIEQSRNIFSLNRDSDTKIYWDDITKIGEDVILVKKD
ncbi:MAG: YlmC/YmxH family sporulation protein [Bacilli bacterium]|nr:YlmC/YmxH family sporulation protein [Bacilli bacterium]